MRSACDDEATLLAVERRPQFENALRETRTITLGPRPRSILGLPGVSESGGSGRNGDVGCTSHSTVENRDGAADSENIDRVEIVLCSFRYPFNRAKVCQF
jgi:hypothetical protein